MQEEIKEVAGAVKATAETAGKAIDAAQSFGGFISEYTHESLKAASGIIADRLNYIRWEKRVKLMEKARLHLERMGFSSPPRPVPMNFAIPLIEAATLEDDDDLQDLWAILLVNAATSDRPNDRRRAYISILEQLTHLDAQILLKIYSLLSGDMSARAAITENLPDSTSILPMDAVFEDLRLPPSEVILSLANLARIGCLDADETWGVQKDYRVAYGTVLGRAFFEAVTLHRP